MYKIEAVIFDWAGTTVDYGSFAPVQAFIEAFQQFGLTPTIQEVRAPMGMLKWNHIHTMMQMPRLSTKWEHIHGKPWTKEDVDAVYATSEVCILKILNNFAKPKPYVLETVASLREKGIKIGSTTGYTNEMMSIVVPEAKKQGYSPDFWASPNGVGNQGRPFPFMVFKNLEMLNVGSVRKALKVGDTQADIQEGKNAGLISVGVLEGSSEMGLSQLEYEALSEEEKVKECERVRKIYFDCGADYVIQNMSELLDLIFDIEQNHQS